MKATDKELTDLKVAIAAALEERGYSRAKLGILADVHPSQVSRICRGEFRTISHNVVRVCKELGLPVESLARQPDAADPSWVRIEASVRRIWDETPGGADRIARVLDTIAQLKDAASHPDTAKAHA